MEKGHLKNSTDKIYSNCCIIDPDGLVLSFVHERKLNNYIVKGLADEVAPINGNRTIKLRFKPSGNWITNGEKPPTPRANKCVVCGTEKYLTRHHVVPYCYRQYFPSHKKDKASKDILCVCITCHSEYEKIANQVRKELAAQLNIEYNTDRSDPIRVKIKKAAHLLWSYLNDIDKQIPNKKIERAIEIIQKYTKKKNIDLHDIEQALEVNIFDDNFQDPHKQTVKKYPGGIDQLSIFWRQHFLNTTKPKYLPKDWKVDMILEKRKRRYE